MLPLLLLLSIFTSIRVFSNELALHIRWPKNWSFSFSISPCNEYLRLISFRIDWFALFAVQGTLNNNNSENSKPQCIKSKYFLNAIIQDTGTELGVLMH